MMLSVNSFFCIFKTMARAFCDKDFFKRELLSEKRYFLHYTTRSGKCNRFLKKKEERKPCQASSPVIYWGKEIKGRSRVMSSEFKGDLYRYYGEEKEGFLRRLFRPKELCYLALFRKAQSCKTPLFRLWYAFRLRLLSYQTQIQIPPRTKIGEGFYIGHLGRVIIHPDTVIGKNVNVGTGVTIGRENRGKREGVPTIGSSCWLGTNSVVVGNIRIGNDVLIAPLAFVNFDVPDHSVVVGNPGRIIPREDATLGYVHNPLP
jgi:serine O-acetyltransferase